MFGRAVKNILRQELLSKGHASQKTLTRAILTSQTTFYKHHLADNEKDIIVYSPLPSLTYPECTIDQYVWNDFNKWSSKTALVRLSADPKHFRKNFCFSTNFLTVNLFTQKVDGITERSVTYGQLRDRCRALAIRLQTVFRLNYGETIAVCLPNSIEFPTVCLAGNEAGTIVTTVNPIYTAGKSTDRLTLFPEVCRDFVRKSNISIAIHYQWQGIVQLLFKWYKKKSETIFFVAGVR